MKKSFCGVLFLFLVLNMLNAQDMTDDVVSIIKNQIEKSVFELNDHKTTILQYILKPQDAPNPDTDSFHVLKPCHLAKLFIFDECNIMIREVSYQSGIFSSKLLNYYNLALTKSKEEKIYLSPIFSYKNKPYYFLGVKDSEKKVLFLFNLVLPAEKKFAFFNQSGELLANSLGLEKEVIAEKIKLITGEDSPEKTALIETHGIKLFLPKEQYFLFE